MDAINQEERLKGAFLDRDGSGVEKLLRDHLCVVGLEEIDNPLPDTFVSGILELDIKLDIPLDVKAFIRPLPLAADFPFRLASEEVKVMGFRLGDYD